MRPGAPAPSPPPAPVPFEQVVAALRDPGFYPQRPAEVAVHETHISCVFLAGERAYKLKKPVVLPYLDYGTPERRRRMCEREIELNRRLAPDTYLGVRSVALHAGRLELADADDPGAVEHVVEMVRFDPAATLDAAVRERRASPADVEAVARRIAQAHANAPARRLDGRGVLAALKRLADESFEELLASEAFAAGRVLAGQRFSDAFLAGNAAMLEARARSGFVRDGHGDLRAEHVLLGEEVQVVDCVEFDDAIREVDVGADLAFLAMDLERLGRRDLADALVAAYRAAGGDPGPDRLVAFAAAARAWVRAKIAVTGGADGEELFALGEVLAWRARLPLALIVCGPPASGKSQLAHALARESGLRRVGSDETRKRLAGIAATATAPAAAYAPQESVRTYGELGRLASEALREDGGAIVDATFGTARDRDAFMAAFADRDAIVLVECRAPAGVLDERARHRESEPDSVSDAGPAVARELRERYEPPLEIAPAARHLVVRTDQPPAEVLGDVAAMLDRALARGEQAAPHR